jgi:hypothetical protein
LLKVKPLKPRLSAKINNIESLASSPQHLYSTSIAPL